ncbi:hypothetical protein BLL52_2224 [Rhodoferax antarcticus ANT.BR]|uniref:Uncharacterized protein n=1 Tax=Rhodoferax antarcticus ANT.BR TaxID=1111071 RepID=A0A1Q8YDC5_9BURK|nr:hypothetical protein BLL52_2224 [Rhodoferax antarcticus ANT.BR]
MATTLAIIVSCKFYKFLHPPSRKGGGETLFRMSTNSIDADEYATD